ncbi:hypothetical protein ABIE66_000768 [Peribacillus sp. B2I2]|jgi:hypothetical protein
MWKPAFFTVTKDLLYHNLLKLPNTERISSMKEFIKKSKTFGLIVSLVALAFFSIFKKRQLKIELSF